MAQVSLESLQCLRGTLNYDFTHNSRFSWMSFWDWRIQKLHLSKWLILTSQESDRQGFSTIELGSSSSSFTKFFRSMQMISSFVDSVARSDGVPAKCFPNEGNLGSSTVRFWRALTKGITNEAMYRKNIMMPFVWESSFTNWVFAKLKCY